MADEVFDSTDVVLQLFGKRESLPDQTGDPLSHCAIETLYVIRSSFNHTMTLLWNHSLICLPIICIERRFVSVFFRYSSPI